MFQILGLNKIKAQDMLNLQLCQFVKFLISKSLWKLKYIIKDILIKLHDAMSVRFRTRFRSGTPNTDWNELASLITRCIWWKLQVQAIGPSDYSDWVSIHRLSNSKAYTQRVDCSLTYILLSEIVIKFVTSAVEMHGKTGQYMMWYKKSVGKL